MSNTPTLSTHEIRMPLPNKAWTPLVTNPATLRALGKL